MQHAHILVVAVWLFNPYSHHFSLFFSNPTWQHSLIGVWAKRCVEQKERNCEKEVGKKWGCISQVLWIQSRKWTEEARMRELISHGCCFMLLSLFFPCCHSANPSQLCHLHMCLIRPECGKWYSNVLLEVNSSENAMGVNVIRKNYNLKQQWWGTTTRTHLWPQQGCRDGWLLENFETGKNKGFWQAALWNDRLTEDIDFSSVHVTKLRVKPQGLRQDYV